MTSIRDILVGASSGYYEDPPESDEQRAARERHEVEYREAQERTMKAHWEWQVEQDRLAKQAAERKAMLNSSPPPGRTTHPYADEPYDGLRQHVHLGTMAMYATGALRIGHGLNNAIQPIGGYNNPYAQQVAQAAMQQKGLGQFYATAIGNIQVHNHVFTPSVSVPKPPPDFMERYYTELEAARAARCVEET